MGLLAVGAHAQVAQSFVEISPLRPTSQICELGGCGPVHSTLFDVDSADSYARCPFCNSAMPACVKYLHAYIRPLGRHNQQRGDERWITGLRHACESQT
jgi:hypothetical protein